MRRLYALFFVSGFPALLYQVVWQRALFAIYGVNVESVTVVVTAFMLGLGLGSLVGGWLSARRGVRRLLTFGVIELGIGAFGLASLAAFAAVGEGTAGAGTAATGVYAFLLVLLPTMLMGATLPLLTAFLVERSGNVGRSVGVLYFVNTLGSAVACLAAGLFLLGWLGQSGTVTLAAAINLLLGTGVLVVARAERRSASSQRPTKVAPAGLLSLRAALVLSGVAGFIALSYEIVWFRVFAFTSSGDARSFALLLGAYLLGLALGSAFSRRFCERHRDHESGGLTQTIGTLIIVANLVGFLVAPLLAWTVTLIWHYAAGLVFVTLAAAALGTVFPLLCHLAVPPSRRAGQGLAYVYLANIVGSAAGSFVTGFVLMDSLPLATISLVLALAGVLVGGVLLLARARRSVRHVALVPSILVLLVLAGPALYDGLYERLHFKLTYAGQRYRALIETKSGVVAMTQRGLVYGGGIYDGEMKTTFDTLDDDSNMLFRTYALSAFHPALEEILVVGLGSGSWTKVLAAHPQVRKVTVIEINPGYLDLIRDDPLVGSVLTDPKVEIVIDDGRRWLRANPGRRFDAIVSNTTFNWRAYASGLIGVEFLELCRAHLQQGGVFYYNTTWHPRVQRTGASVFPYALLVGNFLAVSDSPLDVDPDHLAGILGRYRIDGRPALGPVGIAGLVLLAREVDHPARRGTRHVMESRASILARTQGYALITDDNMGTEWDWLRIDSVDRVAHP